MIAHLIFRNTDGSFSAVGWLWLAFNSSMVAMCAWDFLFPDRLVKRMEMFGNLPHPVLVARVFCCLVGAFAGAFALMAIASGPGQLV